jgi:hypothetical protein
MVRSLAFGSTTHNSNRTFCTRFRFGSGAELLNLAVRSNSRAHYAKGTRSGIPLTGHSPPTACRYMVSGSFHSPNRGSFHHFRSRYWFAIGRQVVLSLRRWTARIQTSFHGAGLTWETSRESRVLSPTGLSPAVAELSRTIRLEPTFVTFALPHKGRTDIPTTPNTQRLWPYTYPVWALSRSLAATEEVASLSFPAGTEMFQFPALAHMPYVFRHK